MMSPLTVVKADDFTALAPQRNYPLPAGTPPDESPPAPWDEANSEVGISSDFEREKTHTDLPLSDTENRPLFKGLSMLRENAFQSTIDSFGVHIAQTKRDHTGQRRPTGREQFPKAQVMDQQNTSLLAGLCHNVGVW